MINILKGGKMLAEGGYGCVFHPEIACNGKETDNKFFISKVQQKDFSAENEIKIGELIKKEAEGMESNPLLNNFAPVISHCPINLSQLKVKDLDSCNVLKKVDTTNLILMKIRYIDSKDFDSFIIENSNSNTILLTLISAFNHLLKSLDILIKANVVQFDLKGQNIVFDSKRSLPIIIDFGLSLPMQDINQNTLLNYFYIYAPEYYVWPLEVHYLNLLLHSNPDPTKGELKNLAVTYTKSNAGLDGMSHKFRKDFEQECYNQLLTYETLTLTERKNNVLKYWKTWDNYSLSIIYLKFIYFIVKSSKKTILKNKFIEYFTEILLTNIHPDPKKRMSIEKTSDVFNKFIYNNDINTSELFQEISENIAEHKIRINKSFSLNRRRIRSLTENSIRKTV
jgi:serine/threonine protein kinase